MSRRSEALARGYSWEPGYMGWVSPEEQLDADEAQAAAEREDEEKES